MNEALTDFEAMLLLRGACQGVPTEQLASEIDLNLETVRSIQKKLQKQARAMQPNSPLADQEIETDEMCQNAGEKMSIH